MSTNLQTDDEYSVDHNDLLELARDLDRFSRRFERFFLVQLEQLDTYALQLERDKQQWERQRARDLQQIQQNRRALQEAWTCLLYTSPSPRDQRGSRMPSSA